jgi:hypothetical protein
LVSLGSCCNASIAFNRRQNQQLDLMARGLALYFFHNRQSAVCTGADHKSVASPRYVLLDRQGRVSEVVPEFFRGLFLPFADLPMVDHDIVFVGAAVDLEENLSKRIREGVLRALLGRDGGEGRPALLDSLAAAVWAEYLAFFVVHKRQNLVEEFLAFLAEELAMGHANLPQF